MTDIVIHTLPAAEGNFGSRNGAAVDTIVIHTMEGNLITAVGRFGTRPPPGEAGVSAHYCVGRDGTTIQCVADAMAAYHAGNIAVNRRSIGIELEVTAFRHGHDGKLEPDPGVSWPEPMMQALYRLARDVVTRHGIPIDREHIIGHCEVPDPDHPGQFGGVHHHQDPGPLFPWQRLMTELSQTV